MLKDARGALKDFGAAIQLSPVSAHMYFNRANLYTSISKFEKAEADYTKSKHHFRFRWLTDVFNVRLLEAE